MIMIMILVIGVRGQSARGARAREASGGSTRAGLYFKGMSFHKWLWRLRLTLDTDFRAGRTDATSCAQSTKDLKTQGWTRAEPYLGEVSFPRAKGSPKFS